MRWVFRCQAGDVQFGAYGNIYTNEPSYADDSLDNEAFASEDGVDETLSPRPWQLADNNFDGMDDEED